MNNSGRYIKQNIDRLALNSLMQQFKTKEGLQREIDLAERNIQETKEVFNGAVRYKKELVANLDTWVELETLQRIGHTS